MGRIIDLVARGHGPVVALGALAVLGSFAAANPAYAGDEGEASASRSAAARAEAGAFLPTTLSAEVPRAGASVVAYSGYDASAPGGSLVTTADIHLIGPLALRVGATYLPGRPEGVFQPNIGLRWQVLRQAAHGIDAAVAFFWRKELITDDDGLFQGVISLGRRYGRLGTFAHVSYGSDDEGDDREGEVSLAELYSATDRLQVGVDARTRFDLWSTDPRRAARGEPGFVLVAGPTASFALGPVALLAQAGYAGAHRLDHYSSGLLALAGLGAAF